MQQKPFRFFSLAVFLAIILVTMLLSRAEEQKKANTRPFTPTTVTQTKTTVFVS